MLGQGTGILALLAAQAGAAQVSCVERSRMLYRMAQQTLAANAEAPNADCITLLPRPLEALGVAGKLQPVIMHATVCMRVVSRQCCSPAGEELPAQAAGDQDRLVGEPSQQHDEHPGSNRADAAKPADDQPAAVLPRRADILITDLMDHRRKQTLFLIFIFPSA